MMKVALVHEFLTQLGGAERVLEALHELFPDAPVYALVYDEQKTQGLFVDWDIRPSFLQKLPGLPRNYKWYLPLMTKAIESFDFQNFDLVISDSSAFAKGICVNKPTVHICYCHTPTRYLWQDMESYVASIPYGSAVKFLVKPYLKHILRPWDYKAAQKPDIFIANSQTVQKRIKQYYNRDSVVVYPPVDTEFFRPTSSRRDYFFTASRLEPYKKVEIVIQAFNELGLKLKVAGDGTKANSLRAIAKSNIEFLGRVSDEELRQLYSEARAFIFPALEDAGIMVLESLACGTPVIGLDREGTAEFIKDGENGLLMHSQTIDAIFSAEKKLSIMKFDPVKLRESALEFDKEVFKKRILEFISDL